MILNVHLYCMICTIGTILIVYTYSNSSTGNHLLQSVTVFYHLLPSVSSCYFLLTSAPSVPSVNLTLIPTVLSITICRRLLPSAIRCQYWTYNLVSKKTSWYNIVAGSCVLVLDSRLPPFCSVGGGGERHLDYMCVSPHSNTLSGKLLC